MDQIKRWILTASRFLYTRPFQSGNLAILRHLRGTACQRVCRALAACTLGLVLGVIVQASCHPVLGLSEPARIAIQTLISTAILVPLMDRRSEITLTVPL